MFELIVFLLGLIFGSFISSYTWRIDKSVKNQKRSVCPKCKSQIKWTDNIPLVSYILLNGRCRECKKKISIRYPLIETCTGLIFAFVYYTFANCTSHSTSFICGLKGEIGFFTLPYLLIIFVIFICIFVIDIERMIIPDKLSFLGFLIVFSVLMLSHNDMIYLNLFAGGAASVFLLSIHLFTKGKGMGLGDVKLALFAGAFLGFPGVIYWLYSAFIIGALVGIFLLITKKAKFKQRIAFGPFLVIGIFVVVFFNQFFNNIFYFF